MKEKVLVVGSKGLAKEILFSFPDLETQFVFYDDINAGDNLMYNRFIIYHSKDEVLDALNNEFHFVIGVGNARNREIVYNKFKENWGSPLKMVSTNSKVGKFETEIGEGTVVLDNAMITNSVSIGKGCLINKAVIISHDVSIGNFCDIAPSVKIMGGATIGNRVDIGANAVVIPNVKIGDNVTIGAGSVVTRDISKNSVVVGSPGRVIRIKE